MAASTLELPRRVTSGLDSARVGMVLAVLQRRADVKIGRHDVYAATVGGVRLTEPSVDLAVALAMSSAAADLSIPGSVVAIGEVGLARGAAGAGRGPQAGRGRAHGLPAGHRARGLGWHPGGGGRRAGAGVGALTDVREVEDVKEAIAADPWGG